MEDNLRQRAAKRLLRVTLPDGSVICHKNATTTFVEALIGIGSENYSKITLENCHLPLLSREVYPRYKDWMRPLVDGWYVNAQGDSWQKYMQLLAIKNQLDLQMDVEIGTDFVTSDTKEALPSKKKDNKIFVKLPDGEYVAGSNPIDTLIETIGEIGPENIWRKELTFANKPIITSMKKYGNQVQVGKNLWLTVPGQTKDKYKLLCLINSMMRLGLEVSYL